MLPSRNQTNQMEYLVHSNISAYVLFRYVAIQQTFQSGQIAHICIQDAAFKLTLYQRISI